ncbi:MAG: FAD-linked oxidase [Cryobacterium sp.]|nr:FAD-linked oxidase [Cryobacterium sp.]
MFSSPSPGSVLEALAADLNGTLLQPDDPEWDTARSPWNLTVDQRPAAVAFPRDENDIRLILSAARAEGLGVTVQPRGHGANGDLSDCILVRPKAFDVVEINVDDRVARIGAGVLWGNVLPQLEGTGLVPLAGTNPDVSVAGYLLSGGHSWFSRWKGLAANSIRAVELVDADGRSRRLSSEDALAGADADLLWALRGGGGLFGIVTALEIDLYPAPGLYGGKLLFPGEAAEEVFEQVRNTLAGAPDELSIFLGMINMPDSPFAPEPLRGRTFTTADVVFVGDAAEGASLLQPILDSAPAVLDQTRAFTIGQLGDVAAEPQDPSPAIDWAATISELDRPGLDSLAAAFREASPAGLTLVQLRPLGGAIAQLGADAHGVVGYIESEYLAFAAAIRMGPDHILDPDRVFGALQDVVEGRTEHRTVPSMLPSGADLRKAYPADTLRRLEQIKRAVDPDNILRSNRPLPSGLPS